MKDHAAVVLMLAVAAIVPAPGCARSSSQIRDIDASVTVLEKVQMLGTAARPDWVLAPGRYKNARPDTQYFVGVGFPRQTLVFATQSAAGDANACIARYIGEAVACKWQRAGGAGTVGGGLWVRMAVEEFALKTLAAAKTQRTKAVETYVERVSGLCYGARIEMNRVIQLYAASRADLVNIAKESAAGAAEELGIERDEARKEQLRKLEAMLKGISIDDFKF